MHRQSLRDLARLTSFAKEFGFDVAKFLEAAPALKELFAPEGTHITAEEWATAEPLLSDRLDKLEPDEILSSAEATRAAGFDPANRAARGKVIHALRADPRLQHQPATQASYRRLLTNGHDAKV
jgi:hypothetical protein